MVFLCEVTTSAERKKVDDILKVKKYGLYIQRIIVFIYSQIINLKNDVNLNQIGLIGIMSLLDTKTLRKKLDLAVDSAGHLEFPECTGFCRCGSTAI